VPILVADRDLGRDRAADIGFELGERMAESGNAVEMQAEEAAAAVQQRTPSPEQMVSSAGAVRVWEAPDAAGEVLSGLVAVEVGVRPLWKALHPHRHYPTVPLDPRECSARARQPSGEARRGHPVSPVYSTEPQPPL
jgi:hypothetical protein